MAKKRRYHRRTTEEQIADLEQEIARLRDRVRSEGQFSPKAVRAERDRLELSAADYAELVGVSGLTIYNWEKGKSRPRREQAERWLAVRGIGKRQAWRQLGY